MVYNIIHFEYGKDIEELCKIFNKCEYFYCYDTFTFTPVIAALCGCITVIIPLDNISKDNIYEDAPWMKYGIAYGDSKEEIENARNTLTNARHELIKMFNNYNCNNIHHFLNLLYNYINE